MYEIRGIDSEWFLYEQRYVVFDSISLRSIFVVHPPAPRPSFSQTFSLNFCSRPGTVGTRAVIFKGVSKSRPWATWSSLWWKARNAKIDGVGIMEMGGCSHILSRNSCSFNNSFLKIQIFWRPHWDSRIIANGRWREYKYTEMILLSPF